MEVIDRGLTLTASSVVGLGFGWVILSHAVKRRADRLCRAGAGAGPPDFMTYLAYSGLVLAHYVAGNFTEFRQPAAEQRRPTAVSYPQTVQVAALVQAERLDEAKVVARRVQELEPNFTVNEFVRVHTGRAEIWDPMGDALRRIGLPF